MIVDGVAMMPDNGRAKAPRRAGGSSSDRGRLDFAEYLDTSGRELQAVIERAGQYAHTTGVGDAREDAVRLLLRQLLSPRFAVDRGRLFDSTGRVSREFDVIVSEAGHVAPAMEVAGRRLVPIEAAYGVIEVKSKLTAKAYRQFIDAVVELDDMRRFYELTWKAFDIPNQVTEGVPPQDPDVGKVWSGIIAFDAPRGPKLGSYLQRHCDGFLFVCVPGRELVTLWVDPPGFGGLPCGVKALPLLAWMIVELVNSSPRPFFLRPAYSKYREQMVNALGDLQGWTLKAGGASVEGKEAQDD
jgi:hypothetical protein